MEFDLLNIPQNIQYSKKQVTAGTVILDGVTENDFLYILASGQATVMYLNEDGNGFAVYSYTAPDFFGEVEVICGNENLPLPIVAKTICTLYSIHKDQVMIWLKQDFSFTKYMLRRLCEKMLSDANERASQKFLTQKQRYLLCVRKHFKNGTLNTLTKSMLCDEISAPMRSLNRTIAQCQDVVIYQKKKFIWVNKKEA